MRLTLAFALVGTFAICTDAANVAYEGEEFPETLGWERVGTLDADRTLDDGSLVIDVDLGEWAPPPGGEQDLYKRETPEFAGKPFYIEWRVKTDAPANEILGVGGSSLVFTGSVATNYHFTIASDECRLISDQVVWWIPLESDAFHTYRLEVFGEDYFAWSIDGVETVSGDPEADVFSGTPYIQWGAKMWYDPSTNVWDYLRYGTIPDPGSGDFDTDGDVDLTDFKNFRECNLGPGVDAGPGCVWADFDGDADVDLADFGAFQAAFTD